MQARHPRTVRRDEQGRRRSSTDMMVDRFLEAHWTRVRFPPVPPCYTVLMSDDREYMRQYMARRYARRMAEATALLGGRCVHCGSTVDLEFDHIDPSTKEFVISQRMAGVSEKRLEAELKKCQLLCKSCHEEKSIGERAHPITFRGISFTSKREAQRHFGVSWKTLKDECP